MIFAVTQKGEKMSEVLAFIIGLVAMMIVWFVTDGSSHSPYRRGYRDGYFDAAKAFGDAERRENEKTD